MTDGRNLLVSIHCIMGTCITFKYNMNKHIMRDESKRVLSPID